MTKRQALQVRNDSYTKPAELPQRCETCKHYWDPGWSGWGHCYAIEIRGRIQTKTVHPLGRCNLWELKDEPE